MSTMILDRRGEVIVSSQSRSDARQLELAQLPLLGDGLHGRFSSRNFIWGGERFIGTLTQHSATRLDGSRRAAAK
jgi:hypothetical protein